jgi:glycosyltransferase involved in cell wall biosynthesis
MKDTIVEPVAIQILRDPGNANLWRRLADHTAQSPTTSKPNSEVNHKATHARLPSSSSAQKYLQLIEKLIESKNAREAEILCRRLISNDLKSKDFYLVKLLECLLLQGKVENIQETYDMADSKENPWLLCFYSAYLAHNGKFNEALAIAFQATTIQNIRDGNICKESHLYCIALSILANNESIFEHLLVSLPYIIDSESASSFLPWNYLPRDSAVILQALRLFESSTRDNSNINKAKCIIRVCFEKWDLFPETNEAIMTFAQCKSTLTTLARSSENPDKAFDRSNNELWISLIYYTNPSSPFHDPFELFLFLDALDISIPSLNSFTRIKERLSKQVKNGFCYQASNSTDYYLNLEIDDMSSVHAKIVSDFSSFRLFPSQLLSHNEELDDSFSLSSAVLCAEANLKHYTSLSNAVVSFIKSVRSISDGSPVKRLFLAPWLKAGGADKIAINWINFCNQIDGDKSILILSENSDSEWISRLRPEIKVIKAFDYLGGFSLDDQAYALALLIQYLKPEITHNFNSSVGYHCAQKFSQFLIGHTKLACTLFCNDQDQYSQWDGYGIRHQLTIYKYFSFIFSDNQYFLESNFFRLAPYISSHINNNQQVIRAIYTPTEIPDYQWNRDTSSRKCIWTGRFDKQKRLDILLSVARKVKDVQFDVYGYILLDGKQSLINELKSLPNVSIKGKYKYFSDLDLCSYDFYLLTSHWEGLPNTLLEAASHGMPIIASNVGGITEILDNKSGYVVDVFDNIDMYAEAIYSFYENYSNSAALGSRIKEKVASQHSYESMQNALFQTSYLSSY